MQRDFDQSTMYFTREKEELGRYQMAFTGVIKESIFSMVLKHIFHEEGLSAIRLTIMGTNLCILENLVCGEVESFIQDRKSWWEQWFTTIRSWQPEDVDIERLLWLRIRGTPCHVWCVSFFISLVKTRGSFIKCDESTMARTSLKEARVCIKSGRKELINLTIKAIIDGESFIINLIEDPTMIKELKLVRRRSRDEDGTEEYVTSEVEFSDEAITVDDS